MKKNAKIPLVLSALFLSGCTLGFSGNDGGVARSDDGGKTFSQKAAVEQNRSIAGADVLSIAVNPNKGEEVYIGTKSSGIFKTGNAGELWKPLAVAPTTPQKAYALAIDPRDSKVVYAAAAVGGRGKIIKSEDEGESWRDVYTEPSDNTLVLALAINPQNPQHIFAGTEQGQIIFSEDSGQTWRSSLWTESKKAVFKIAFDNANPALAFFAVFGEGLLRTTDEGKSLESLTRGSQDAFSLARDLAGITAIATDPARGGWIYAGLPEGLLRSRDAGATWETIKTLNKPEGSVVRSIAINPSNSEELVLGASQAFYKSIDGGVNWLPVQFDSRRTLEVIAYNSQNPSQIFVGMNKR